MAAGVDVSRLVIVSDSSQIKATTGDLKDFALAGGTAATASGNLEGSLKRMIVSLGGIAAVVAHFKAATAASLEFSTAMGRVSTVIGNMGDMPAMRRGLTQMAELMGGSAASQAGAMYDILSAGISDTALALDMLAASNKLAVGGVTSVGVAADGLTSIMMAYGDQVKSTQDASDAMFVSAAIGKTTIEELSHTVGRVIPVAANAGVSLDELLASIGALTKGGINTHQSVDGLRAMLAAVIKPSEDASKMAKKLGIDFTLAGLQTKGFVGFIDDLAKKTKGNTEQMAKLMGGIEAIVPAMALTGSGLKDLHDGMDRMAIKAGETEVAFKKMADTPQYKIDQLKAKMSNMMIETGDNLMKWLAPMAEFGTKHFDTIIKAVNGVAAAIAFLVAGKLGGWVGTQIEKMQQWASQIIINRAHTIALAEDEVRSTAVKMAAAQATQAQVIAAGAVNNSYIAQIGYEKKVRAAIAETTAATIAHEVATNKLSVAGSALTAVKNGLKSVVAALGGPFGVATMAAMALLWAFNALNDADEKLREGMIKHADAAADGAGKNKVLMDTLKEQHDVMEKAKKGSAEYTNAEKKMEIAKTQLMALGPEYRSVLTKEIDSYEKLAEAIKKVNAEKLKKVNADLAELDKSKGGDLSWWQHTKAFVAGSATQGAAGAGLRTKYMLENIARDEEARNKLLASKAALEAAMVESGPAKATKTKIPVPHSPDKDSEKEMAELERYVKNLEHEAAVMGKTKTEAIELSESYKKLSGAMKMRADVAIGEMDRAELAKKEKDETEKLRQEMISLHESLLPLEAESDKYRYTLEGIELAVQKEIITDEMAIKMRKRLGETMTETGRAAEKWNKDKESYAAQLNPEDEVIKKMAMLNELMRAGKVGLKEYGREQERLLRQMSDGFDLLCSSIETASGAMGDALVKFATTGKFSMKDMVNSMLQDLARLMANRAMAALLDMAVGAITTWATSGNAANQDYNASGTGQGGDYSGSTAYHWRAAGGPVTAGQPYIVGEKRPELFVPNSNGTIIPQVGGSGNEIIINITVNAEGEATTNTQGKGNSEAKAMAEAIGMKIRKTIQEELAPGGDIYTFVKR